MIKGEKETLDKMTEGYVCAEHSFALVTAWSAEENSYAIKCGKGHYPEEIKRNPSQIEGFKQGTVEPVGKGLNLLPRVDLGTGEVLGKEMQTALILYAERYGLDAFRAHVYIMYGKPYIGLDGYLYLANKTTIPYQLRSRPLTEDERKTYLIAEHDHAWTCEIVLPLTSQSFTGLGIVTNDEMTAVSSKNPSQARSPVVAAHPWQLAQKRAEWQALRRAFPFGETEEGKEV